MIAFNEPQKWPLGMQTTGIWQEPFGALKGMTMSFHDIIDVRAAVPAEEASSPDILFELGLVCSSGQSGPIDLIAAHKWFNLAALRGRKDAIVLRREVAELMSESEIAVAQREARAWMSLH
jgi:hypothetical protein